MVYKLSSRRSSFVISFLFFGIIFFGVYWIIGFEVAVGVLLIMILAHLVWLGEDKFDKNNKSSKNQKE